MVAKREFALMGDGDDDDETKSEIESSIMTADKLEISRGIADRLQVFSSIFLRVIIYIFLQWIPSTFCTKVVPSLYVIYVITWTFRQRSVQSAVVKFINSAQLLPAIEQLDDLTANIEVNGSSSAVIKSEGNESIEHLAEPEIENEEEEGTMKEGEEERKGVQPLSFWEMIKMALFGHSTRSQSANRISFALHSLLFCFFLDSLWSPYLFPSHLEHNLDFARVGGLSPKSAIIHVRYPFPMGQPQDLFRGDSGVTWNALIEEDTAGGSLGGLLRSGKELYSNPEPVRVVYREVYGGGLTSTSTGVVLSDEGNLAGSPASIDGRPRSSPKRWERGPLLHLTEDEDWTASAKIDNLWPSTEYEWRLAFVHNSTFTPMPSRARRFITWPDPRLSSVKSVIPSQVKLHQGSAPLDDPNHFTFASSSCVKADFPWVPTQFWAWSWLLRSFGIGNQLGGFSVRNRIPGFDTLARAVLDHRDQPTLRFFLQLGDLIYADVPHFGGPNTASYRKLYRNLFASESFRRVFERLPIIGIYDDHEVENNWGGTKLVGEEDSDQSSTYKTEQLESFPPAQQAWKEYVGAANPEPLEAGENYYTFRYGETAFFVLDTRKHRTPHQLPDDETKTMLGYKQKESLLRWLGAVNSTATFKFIVSSVPFTTLWGGPLDWDGKKDSWAAYTYERESLLQVMQYVPNIIILSGDRHEFASVGVAPQGTRNDFHPVTEFSTSPLSMFYLPVRTLSSSHGLGPTGAERLYKYLPDGNVKWTEFEVDTRDASEPQVQVRVMIDGKEAWSVQLRGVPVRQPKGAIGGIAKSFLELLNWRPRKWFR